MEDKDDVLRGSMSTILRNRTLPTGLVPVGNNNALVEGVVDRRLQ